jgi:hypothetical protein
MTGNCPPLALLLTSTLFLQGTAIAQIQIRANQVGYEPEASKIAIAFGMGTFPPGFEVTDADSNAVVFRERAVSLPGVRWGKFENHVELDFSQLQLTGRYVIRFGSATSLPFEITPRAATGLPDSLLAFMRQQRCGYNPWLDASCHTNDGRTAFGPLPYGSPLPAHGGWHDAGDLLKYLITAANATAEMLLAWELNRENARLQRPGATNRFGDHFDALGRTGANHVPDVLDEAKWGLEWMLRLHPAPDQLYHQVADDRDHIGWRLPQNETADYGWGKGGARVVYFADGHPQGLQQYKSDSSGIANLAGKYAAAMALAWQVWKEEPLQKEFALKCLKAGQEVYALGRAKEGVQQGNSYRAPYRYEESTWADDMEWGAAELFRATGEPGYLADARRYAELAGSEGWMGRTETRHYQFYPFMNLGHFRLHGVVDRRFAKKLEGYYREGLERCVAAGKRNPYRMGAPFIWCSNNLLVGLVTQGLLYERMSGDKQFLKSTALQRDWLLGRNPWGYAMFTGVGARWPREVHLMTVQILKRPVTGGLVDGPVYDRVFRSLKGVSITLPDPLAEFQGEAVYHDDVQDYSTNEPTMDGTASAILMFAIPAG